MITRDEVCWHCSEPLQPAAVVYASVMGQSRALCCQGCRAAAQWIEQLGLSDYYRLRTSPAQKPHIDLSDANLSAKQGRAWLFRLRVAN
jgi:Cu2+-exporting ATPase